MRMRDEAEVREQLRCRARELAVLDAEMERLRLQVRLGGDGWQDSRLRLSALRGRRPLLQADYDTLRWAVSPDD